MHKLDTSGGPSDFLSASAPRHKTLCALGEAGKSRDITGFLQTGSALRVPGSGRIFSRPPHRGDLVRNWKRQLFQ